MPTFDLCSAIRLLGVGVLALGMFQTLQRIQTGWTRPSFSDITQRTAPCCYVIKHLSVY